MLDFDEMLLQVGEFGLYQKALFAFQAPFCIFVTFVLFGQLFMTLYPNVMWCGGHFNCTLGTMSPFQRQNFSFSYTGGDVNPCFINNIDASFIKSVVDWQNRDSCGRLPCNYNHTTNFSSIQRSQPSAPEAIYSHYGHYGRFGAYGGGGYGPSAQDYDDRGNTFKYYPEMTTSSWGRRPTQWPGPANPWSSVPTRDSQKYDWGETTTTTKPFAPYNPTTAKARPTPTTTGRTTTTTFRTTENTWASTSTSGKNNKNPNGNPTDSNPEFGDNNTPGSSLAFSGRPLPFSSNQTCSEEPPAVMPKVAGIWCCTERVNITTRAVNETVNGRNRTVVGLIELPELPANYTPTRRNAPMKTPLGEGGQREQLFVPYRTPPYQRVEECYNISWDPVQSGVLYPTIVTEGMWWCNAESYTIAAQSVFFLGAIVGGFLIGYIADSYGRVPALVMANILGAVGGALSVVSTNFWIFMFFRFITGMAFDNCFTMMYILVLEFCGPTYRTLVANLSIAVFYTLGTLILPWLALWIGDWKVYGLAISLPMLLGLMAIFLVPESARWLLSKGRTKEATNILRSFAKVNGKQVDEAVFVEFENDARKIYEEMQAEDEEASFTAALKTPRLRRTFILLVMIWSMIALVYDGHSRNILNLANAEWNVFWMFTIASMTEFPADMLLIFTLDRFGRRWLSFGSLTLSGAASIIAAAIPPEMATFALVMAIISRFFVNVAFNIGLQYAAELLPTVIRAQGVNAIHIIGYVASIISPYVAGIGRRNPALSLILLGAFAIIGGCLSLFLSETLGEDLPNTLEEAEAFGLNQSFWDCPICSKPKDEEHFPIDEPQPDVVRRNNIRASMRGETYRSSIISSSSRGSRGRAGIAMNPSASPATETTKLNRRITH